MNGHVVAMWVNLSAISACPRRAPGPDILEMRWRDVPMRAPGCSIISNQSDPAPAPAEAGTRASQKQDLPIHWRECRVPCLLCWVSCLGAPGCSHTDDECRLVSTVSTDYSFSSAFIAACAPMMLQVVWPAADCHNGHGVGGHYKVQPDH